MLIDKKKRVEVRVRKSYGRSRYRITGDEIVGVVKSDKRGSFLADVGALVRTKCTIELESWRAILEELKMQMIDELAVCVNFII